MGHIGVYGFIEVFLRDPVSEMVKKVRKNKVSSVGVYHRGDVDLFNTYDTARTLHIGRTTLEDILKYPYVTGVKYHPLSIHNKPIMSRASISRNTRGIIQKIIQEDSMEITDYRNVRDNPSNNGYTMMNRIQFSILDRENMENSGDRIVETSILQEPIFNLVNPSKAAHSYTFDKDLLQLYKLHKHRDLHTIQRLNSILGLIGEARDGDAPRKEEIYSSIEAIIVDLSAAL